MEIGFLFIIISVLLYVIMMAISIFSDNLIYPNGRRERTGPNTYRSGEPIWYTDKKGNYRRYGTHEIVQITKVELNKLIDK